MKIYIALILVALVLYGGSYNSFQETEEIGEICKNETIQGAFTFKINEPNVYCFVNETLTKKAIESNYPYTIYTCIKEICEGGKG